MPEEKELIPTHIAIIMDGNRRWAKSHGKEALEGHKAGAENLERLAEYASSIGVKTLTVYALSTENLTSRVGRELQGLFDLFIWGFKHKIKKLVDSGVRVNVIGDVTKLPDTLQKLISSLKQSYKDNDSFTLNIALNYGGKQEILHAVKAIIKDGIDIDKLTESDIAKRLYTKDQHEPDLVIRTGGQVRLSNFLLWQSSYSELYFTKIYWPDFGPKQLDEAILWYQEQKRNFGK
ncbi:MAG: polyprenyl diphosphate synthase [Candidatus Roizmanbacteria bacterium]